MLDFIKEIFISSGLPSGSAATLSRGTVVLLVVFAAFISDLAAKRFILSLIKGFVAKTDTRLDDILFERKVFLRIAHLAPAVVIYVLAPSALDGYTNLVSFVETLSLLWIFFSVVLAIDAIINAVYDIYQGTSMSREIPIKGVIQAVKLVLYLMAVIVFVALAIRKSPFYLLSGLGAMTAILMLVFKDVILGFASGIQLTANRMVAHGDWVEMPKYGADGEVIDIALTTVKVQNWDKTITTIPTHALISESFKNWRGMSEAEGRRIKRAINIDMGSIRFCDEAMLMDFSLISLIKDYLERKRLEISEENRAAAVDESSPVNGRRLTNIGTFRAYVAAYLRNHPMINQDMTLIVRQLAPSEKGLPIEIYVFCRDKAWANYESIQSDIFDHILAVIPQFGLRIFQNPTGSDFRQYKD